MKTRRPHVAVGVLSGAQDAAPADEQQRRAVDFFIDKPVSIAALDEAVARVRAR